MTNYLEFEKTPSFNGRFGASGGVGSSESEQVTSSFALVQTAVNPPPVAKPLGRCMQALRLIA